MRANRSARKYGFGTDSSLKLLQRLPHITADCLSAVDSTTPSVASKLSTQNCVAIKHFRKQDLWHLIKDLISAVKMREQAGACRTHPGRPQQSWKCARRLISVKFQCAACSRNIACNQWTACSVKSQQADWARGSRRRVWVRSLHMISFCFCLCYFQTSNSKNQAPESTSSNPANSGPTVRHCQC